MKETSPQKLKESFVATMSLDGDPYVLRFVLQPFEEQYLVLVLNKPTVMPFCMGLQPEKGWRIIEAISGNIMALEQQLADAICDNNR